MFGCTLIYLTNPLWLHSFIIIINNLRNILCTNICTYICACVCVCIFYKTSEWVARSISMIKHAEQSHPFRAGSCASQILSGAGSYLMPLYHMTAHHPGHNWIGIVSSPKAAIWRLVRSLWGAQQETSVLRGISFPGGGLWGSADSPWGCWMHMSSLHRRAGKIISRNQSNQWVLHSLREEGILCCVVPRAHPPWIMAV